MTQHFYTIDNHWLAFDFSEIIMEGLSEQVKQTGPNLNSVGQTDMQSMIDWWIDWLILIACQSVQCYFMPTGEGITFIVRLYLDFCMFFKSFFFVFEYEYSLELLFNL